MLKCGTQNFILSSEKQETISRNHKSFCLPLDHQGFVMFYGESKKERKEGRSEGRKEGREGRKHLPTEKKSLSILTSEIQSRKSTLW